MQPISQLRSAPIALHAFQPRHLHAVVDIHRRAFPRFFLTSLGDKFLREFYSFFLRDPLGIAFVACGAGGEVLGAAVGPLEPTGFFRRMLRRRWWAFSIASIQAILRNPVIMRRLARALVYRGDAPSGKHRALLSSIAVSPSAQGAGVGKDLVRRWCEEAQRRGARGCYLTTDADENDRVNGFYESMGWLLDSTYITSEGRRMNLYVFDFDL